jgi:hypothetical protein
LYRPLLYDEEIQSKNIYEKGFTNNTFNVKEAVLISKYLRHILKYGDVRIRKSLIVFSEQSDPFFNSVIHSDAINNAVKKSKKDFIKKEGLFITSGEIDKIKEVIIDFQEQKFCLGVIAFAKRDYGYASVKKWVDIKRIMNINFTEDRLYGIIFTLYQKGMVYPTRSKKYDPAHKVLFLESGGIPAIDITTDREFNRLGKMYEEYNGGVSDVCVNCGNQFIKIGKSRYCEVCSKEKNLEKHKKYNQKRRNK